MSSAYKTASDFAARNQTIPAWTLLIPSVLLIAQSSLGIQKCSFQGNDRHFINVSLAIGVIVAAWSLFLIFRRFISGSSGASSALEE